MSPLMKLNSKTSLSSQFLGLLSGLIGHTPQIDLQVNASQTGNRTLDTDHVSFHSVSLIGLPLAT